VIILQPARPRSTVLSFKRTEFNRVPLVQHFTSVGQLVVGLFLSKARPPAGQSRGQTPWQLPERCEGDHARTDDSLTWGLGLAARTFVDFTSAQAGRGLLAVNEPYRRARPRPPFITAPVL
jgi:hypothetical protein